MQLLVLPLVLAALPGPAAQSPLSPTRKLVLVATHDGAPVDGALGCAQGDDPARPWVGRLDRGSNRATFRVAPGWRLAVAAYHRDHGVVERSYVVPESAVDGCARLELELPEPAGSARLELPGACDVSGPEEQGQHVRWTHGLTLRSPELGVVLLEGRFVDDSPPSVGKLDVAAGTYWAQVWPPPLGLCGVDSGAFPGDPLHQRRIDVEAARVVELEETPRSPPWGKVDVDGRALQFYLKVEGWPWQLDEGCRHAADRVCDTAGSDPVAALVHWHCSGPPAVVRVLHRRCLGEGEAVEPWRTLAFFSDHRRGGRARTCTPIPGGALTTRRLAPGRYELRVEGPAVETWSGEVTIDASPEGHASAFSEQDVVIELVPRGR